MDAEALKIILSLKEENIFYKRAIVDAIVMINNRKEHLILEYGISDNDVNWLFSEIRKLLPLIEKEKKPTNKSQNTNSSTNEFP